MTALFVLCVTQGADFSPAESHRFHSSEARRLLALAVKRVYGLDTADLKEMKTKEGKPYFDTLPFHFSLSHSKGVVACALSDHEVGLDVEKITSISDGVMRRFVGCVGSTQEENTRLWTRYESCGKLLGIGIPYPKEEEERCFFKSYTSLEGYVVTLCSHWDDLPDEIVFMN